MEICRRKQSVAHKEFRAMTMPELLVVMIVSGIVFLLLFDGLGIVRQYGYILERRFTEKSSLLYSHQTLETLLEKTDSIRCEGKTLLLYINDDPFVQQLGIDSTYILLYGNDYIDTLFNGLTDVQLYSVGEDDSFINVLTLFLRMGTDTIQLDYGIQ